MMAIKLPLGDGLSIENNWWPLAVAKFAVFFLIGARESKGVFDLLGSAAADTCLRVFSTIHASPSILMSRALSGSQTNSLRIRK